MTLGQCLEEIRKSFLGGSTELMSKVGMGLIREIKVSHFPNGDFPRHGWFLLLEPVGPVRVSNGQVSVNLCLDSVARSSTTTPLSLYTKNY